MLLRYKNTLTECHSSSWNPYGMAEVLTGDDSASMNELEAFIEQKGIWLDMYTALKARDIISDNSNLYFQEPSCKEDRIRGYYL